MSHLQTNEHHVLNNICASVNKGTLLIVIGPVGAGKVLIIPQGFCYRSGLMIFHILILKTQCKNCDVGFMALSKIFHCHVFRVDR